VNFIYAHVFCTICLANGSWDKPLEGDGCQICGKHRWFSWSPFDYNSTAVDVKYQTQNPLADFTEWLLKFWKKPKERKQPGDDNQEQPPKKVHRRRTKRRLAEKNPFLDLEAEDEDGDEEEDEHEGDDAEMADFIGSDNEDLGEDDFIDGLNVYRALELQEEQRNRTPPIDELDDFLEMRSAGNGRMDDEEMERYNAIKHIFEREKEEEAKKQAEEEAKRQLRIERRKKREVATFAYAHYGAKYDNVGF